MLHISCPWCGSRAETEFRYGGEAHIARPEKPADLSDQQWTEFLFMRTNTKGVFAERWCHSNGCRQWFNLLRNTVSHEILGVYRNGENPPEILNDGGA